MGVHPLATAVCYVISAVVTVLLGIGKFSHSWISGQGCEALEYRPSCCQKYFNTPARCGMDFGLARINEAVDGMILAAFIMTLVVNTAFFFGGWCWCSDFRFSEFIVYFNCQPRHWHRGCGIMGGFLLWLFPVAAGISFAGCMIVLNDMSGASFGYSFYVCLVGSCLLILLSIALLIYVFCQRSKFASNLREIKYTNTHSQSKSSSNDCKVTCLSLNPVLYSGDISEPEDDEECDRL